VIVSYTPADGPVEEVSTDDLSAIESSVIESATGLEWDDVERALKSQSPTAMRAVLWAFRKRTEPTLRFSAFDVPGWKRRLKAGLEYEDVLELVESLREKQQQEPDEEAFEQMLKHMRTMAHTPDDVDRAVAETAPKAPTGSPAKRRAVKPQVEVLSEESAATS
jgi:hypothetical protein